MVPYHQWALGWLGLTTPPTFQSKTDRSAACQCICCSRVESRHVESVKLQWKSTSRHRKISALGMKRKVNPMDVTD